MSNATASNSKPMGVRNVFCGQMMAHTAKAPERSARANTGFIGFGLYKQTSARLYLTLPGKITRNALAPRQRICLRPSLGRPPCARRRATRGGLLLYPMSVEALSWAFKQTVGDSVAKLILIALADHANEEFVCTPGRKTLARYAECSTDTVDRKVALLVTAKLAEKVARRSDKGDPTSNAYRLRVAATCGHPQPQPCGYPGRTGAATMMNHSSEPEDIFGDADGNPAKPIESRFDAFYRLYPRKTGKAAAERAWNRLHLDAKADTVIPALNAQIRAGMFKTEPHFIPHPATWLNAGRWEDEITHENRSKPNGASNRTTGQIGAGTGRYDNWNK